MTKHLAFVAGALLTVGGLNLMGPTRILLADDGQPDLSTNKDDTAAARGEEPNYTSGDKRMETMTLPTGISKSEKDNSNEIRSILASTVQSALTKNDMRKLVGNFAKLDRERLDSYAKENKDATIAGRIEQIRQAWKQKYGQDFDVDQKLVFGPGFKDFAIAQGEITNPALLSNWPVGPTKSAGEEMTKGEANQPGARGLEKGREVAIVTFPAGHGLPEVNVSLNRESFDRWRIDVPDTLDGQTLHDSLLNHLTMVGEMSNQWPADVNDAYRLVAHHVLAAIYDVKASTDATPNDADTGNDEQKMGHEMPND